jgi:hypothetical protein
MAGVFLFLALLLLQTACSWQGQSAQTGHREIAAAIRELLTRSYAGIDYAAYRNGLARVETVVAAHLPDTPARLRDHVAQMLAYLRTAEEVLRWQAGHGAGRADAGDRAVTRWIGRYPFLRMAVGARAEAPQAFDAPTAVILLWDKTDAVLRGLQLKSREL